MKYDLFTFHAWLGLRWGWRSAIPLTLFWVILWPVGLIWATVSLVTRYYSHDKSAMATNRRAAAREPGEAYTRQKPIPFHTICWALCWLPLIGQGLVPIILELAGANAKALFIAFYLPEPYKWPFMIIMTILGAILLSIALRGTYNKRNTFRPAA